jgi:predicted  nucleic acid-binding Zn-ribbon protein
VHNDLHALLALQADDAVVDELESRLADLEPRALDLERQRQVAADALARARAAAEADEKKQRELERRLADHKQRQDRNLAALDAVRRQREASAAMAQVEMARKILIEEEQELAAIARRVAEGHKLIGTQEQGLADLEAGQQEERDALERERQEIEASLAEARAKRDDAARGVPRSLLARYERIRHRRRGDRAVFPLRGPSCGNCDTAIPLQRRNIMVGSGAIEVCEACGVLLYASE